MKKYKLYMVIEQRDKILGGYVMETECNRPPRIGEGFNQLIEPPIKNYIVRVEELNE
jgi:hypothetical protein